MHVYDDLQKQKMYVSSTRRAQDGPSFWKGFFLCL